MIVGIGNCMTSWHAKIADIAPVVLADLLTERTKRDRNLVAAEVRGQLGAVCHMGRTNGCRRLTGLKLIPG